MNEKDGVALQHYLESEVQRGNVSNSITDADFLQILQAKIGVLPYTDKNYLLRIAQVAYERYTAQNVIADAPTMIIIPTPLNSQQMDDLLGDRRNYVLAFAAESIFFQDTVHALATDSHYCGEVNVLGAHIDWLSADDSGVNRAIIMDGDGIVKEVGFHRPVSIHVIQILHLPLKNECQLHRDLSARFGKGIIKINPFDSSKRADNKACTHSFWNQYEREIVSPKHILIPQGSSWDEINKSLNTTYLIYNGPKFLELF